MPRPVGSAEELRARALALLARRAHGRDELAFKLARYQPAAADLAAVLDGLAQAGLLDDARFASDLAGSLARAGRSGPHRIAAKLRGHRLDRAEREKALAGVEADWEAACRRLAADRVRRGLDPRDPRDRDRLVRYLLGRGYDGEVVRRAVESLGAEGVDGG